MEGVSASLPCSQHSRGTGRPRSDRGGWTRWALAGLTQEGSGQASALSPGDPLPHIPPAMAGPGQNLHGWSSKVLGHAHGRLSFAPENTGVGDSYGCRLQGGKFLEIWVVVPGESELRRGGSSGGIGCHRPLSPIPTAAIFSGEAELCTLGIHSNSGSSPGPS